MRLLTAIPPTRLRRTIRTNASQRHATSPPERCPTRKPHPHPGHPSLSRPSAPCLANDPSQKAPLRRGEYLPKEKVRKKSCPRLRRWQDLFRTRYFSDKKTDHSGRHEQNPCATLPAVPTGDTLCSRKICLAEPAKPCFRTSRRDDSRRSSSLRKKVFRKRGRSPAGRASARAKAVPAERTSDHAARAADDPEPTGGRGAPTGKGFPVGVRHTRPDADARERPGVAAARAFRDGEAQRDGNERDEAHRDALWGGNKTTHEDRREDGPDADCDARNSRSSTGTDGGNSPRSAGNRSNRGRCPARSKCSPSRGRGSDSNGPSRA